jgi:hypothetical protein
LAILKGGFTVIDLKQHREVGTVVPDLDAITQPSFSPRQPSLSPRGDKVIDFTGAVWDIKANRLIYRAKGECVFADGGNKIAWIEAGPVEAKLRWRDLNNNRDLSERDIVFPGGSPANFKMADPDGHRIIVDEVRYNTGLTWNQKILAWLGIKQNIPRTWLASTLIEAGTGQILYRAGDEVLAVSSDGNYVVLGNWDGSRVRVFEMPYRRSLLFIAGATGVWMALAVIALRFRRWRRLTTSATMDDQATRELPVGTQT